MPIFYDQMETCPKGKMKVKSNTQPKDTMIEFIMQVLSIKYAE